MGSSFVAAAPCQATEQESVGQDWEQAEVWVRVGNKLLCMCKLLMGRAHTSGITG